MNYNIYVQITSFLARLSPVLVSLCSPLSLWEASAGGRRKCIMANYNYSFTFFVCFCFGLLILFDDFVILLYLILICHSYCFKLFVSFPFGWCINSVSGTVFLFSGCGFVLFSLLAYRFGSCVSVLGLRFSVSLFCFYRPQYKLNRYWVASKSNHWRQFFTRQRICRNRLPGKRDAHSIWNFPNLRSYFLTMFLWSCSAVRSLLSFLSSPAFFPWNNF